MPNAPYDCSTWNNAESGRSRARCSTWNTGCVGRFKTGAAPKWQVTPTEATQWLRTTVSFPPQDVFRRSAGHFQVPTETLPFQSVAFRQPRQPSRFPQPRRVSHSASGNTFARSLYSGMPWARSSASSTRKAEWAKRPRPSIWRRAWHWKG